MAGDVDAVVAAEHGHLLGDKGLKTKITVHFSLSIVLGRCKKNVSPIRFRQTQRAQEPREASCRDTSFSQSSRLKRRYPSEQRLVVGCSHVPRQRVRGRYPSDGQLRLQPGPRAPRRARSQPREPSIPTEQSRRPWFYTVIKNVSHVRLIGNPVQDVRRTPPLVLGRLGASSACPACGASARTRCCIHARRPGRAENLPPCGETSASNR